MGIFGDSAILAVKLFAEKKVGDPIEAWEQAITTQTKSESVRMKCCPKSAFLGLCEVGLIHGIPKGTYTNSKKNKKYAIDAVKILRKNPTFLNENNLWVQIVRKTIVQNGQMEVVLALWRNGLLVK